MLTSFLNLSAALASGIQSIKYLRRSIRGYFEGLHIQRATKFGVGFAPQDLENDQELQRAPSEKEVEADNTTLYLTCGVLFGFNAYRIAMGEVDPLSVLVSGGAIAKTVYDAYRLKR